MPRTHSTSNAKPIKFENIRGEDTIIAFMGPTGTGKSSFIDMASRQSVKTAGHSLKSYTSDIRAVTCLNPDTGIPCVLVDTPGFNDTNKSDTEILAMISDWLEKTYRKNIRLAGIVYLHRITDNRMGGSPLKNLDMFGKLCGDSAIGNVVLATTMWGKVKDRGAADRREQQLKEGYWKVMVQLGSTAMRFEDTFKSAWEIINQSIAKGPEIDRTLLIQEEMVELNRRLSETEAGKVLYTTLQKLLADQKETIRKLRDEAAVEDNETLVRELTVQFQEIQESLQHTFDQISKMKVPFGRRLLLQLSFKRTKAKPVASPKSPV